MIYGKLKMWCTVFDESKVANIIPRSVCQICLVWETFESHLSMQKLVNKKLLDKIDELGTIPIDVLRVSGDIGTGWPVCAEDGR